MDYEQRYKEALDEAKAIHKIIKKRFKANYRTNLS